jgi:hypothetical protein
VIHFPVLRWGEPYQSLEVDKVVHFDTGEPVAEVSQANPGIVQRDLRKAERARDVLREFSPADLIGMVKKGAELFSSADLPLGDGTQSPDDFVRQQSATTGLRTPSRSGELCCLAHSAGQLYSSSSWQLGVLL